MDVLSSGSGYRKSRPQMTLDISYQNAKTLHMFNAARLARLTFYQKKHMFFNAAAQLVIQTEFLARPALRSAPTARQGTSSEAKKNRTFLLLHFNSLRKSLLSACSSSSSSSFLPVNVQYLLCLKLSLLPAHTDLTLHTIAPAICATAACLQKHVRGCT